MHSTLQITRGHNLQQQQYMLADPQIDKQFDKSLSYIRLSNFYLLINLE